MLKQMEAGLVRIHNLDDQVVGVGFLADDHLILTCAHVIGTIFGEHQDESVILSKIVHLDFTLIDPEKVLSSKVNFISFKDDIACLEIIEDMPRDARPLPLINSEDPWQHRSHSFGFPSGNDHGVWVSGNIAGPTGKGWIQIEVTNTSGYKIQEGFSGGPIWDKELQGVVGMIAAIESKPSIWVAYGIPVKSLISVSPALKQRSLIPCPYRGLSAFREKDSLYFFGRETFTNELEEAVLNNPFVGVVGPSGYGKSSIVFAGLIPQLRERGEWEIIDFRPTAEPFKALASALLPFLEPKASEVIQFEEITRLAEDFASGAVHLSTVIDRMMRKEPAMQRLLLIIDQFEEIYAVCEDPDIQRLFIDEILEASRAKNNGSLTILLTVRIEFLSQLTTYRPLVDALQSTTLMLGPMSPEELKRAIVHPAQKCGVEFESGLPDAILRQFDNQPGTLPLMQFALTQLWGDSQEDRILTFRELQDLGGVDQALSNYAESAYQKLTEEEQKATRNLLTQLVVHGIQTGAVSRLTLRSQLNDRVWELVKRLADLRLVVTNINQFGEETVEIVHETLVRNWPTLHQWVQEDWAFRSWQDRLLETLTQWKDDNQEETGLLSGLQLREAINWYELRGSDLGDPEKDFILLSQRVVERNRRKIKIAQYSFIFVLLIISFVSIYQTREAQNQSRLSLSRLLSIQSVSALSDNKIDLAFLLAVESSRAKDTPESQNALLSGLAFNPRLLTSVSAHSFAVRAVAFSPNMNLLASSSCRSLGKNNSCNSGEIILWDYSGLNRVSRIGEPLSAHTSYVSTIAFNPKGGILASGSIDHKIILWDISNPAAPFEIGSPLIGHTGSIENIAFSPNGKILASGSKDGTVIFWDVARPTSPRQIGEPYLTSSQVKVVVFSPNGELLASAESNGIITLWKIPNTGIPIQLTTLISGDTNTLNALSFSPISNLLVSGYSDGKIIFWDVADPLKPIQFGNLPIRFQSPVNTIAFNLGGNIMAIGSGNGEISLWNTSSPESPSIIDTPFSSDTTPIYAIAFSSDGNVLAAGNRDGDLSIWIASNKTRPTQIGNAVTGHSSDVNVVQFSHNGKVFASGSADKTIILWNVSDRGAVTQITAPISGHTSGIFALAFSPDDKILASGGCNKRDDEGSCVNGEIYIWNISNPDKIGLLDPPLLAHASDVLTVAFSPDGKTLASGSKDHTIILWDFTDPHQPRPFQNLLANHYGSVNAIAFSPDGKFLASGSSDHTVRLWDISNPAKAFQISHPLTNLKESVRAIAFSPDGRTLAAGGGEYIILWNISNLEEPTQLGDPLFGHTDKIRGLAFSPDSKILTSGGADDTIMLWDSSKPLVATRIGPPIIGHKFNVLSVAFSPDGRFLASGGADELIIFWKLSSTDWMRQTCGRTARNLNLSEWENYIGDISPYRPTCPDLPIPDDVQAVQAVITSNRRWLLIWSILITFFLLNSFAIIILFRRHRKAQKK